MPQEAAGEEAGLDGVDRGRERRRSSSGSVRAALHHGKARREVQQPADEARRPRRLRPGEQQAPQRRQVGLERRGTSCGRRWRRRGRLCGGDAPQQRERRPPRLGVGRAARADELLHDPEHGLELAVGDDRGPGPQQQGAEEAGEGGDVGAPFPKGRGQQRAEELEVGRRQRRRRWSCCCRLTFRLRFPLRATPGASGLASASCARTWNTYGWNSCTSFCKTIVIAGNSAASTAASAGSPAAAAARTSTATDSNK